MVKIKKEKIKIIKDEDINYKEFRTSKANENNNKDIKESKSKSKSYKASVKNEETPSGETPGQTPGLQISKEELIKISKDPVANYYTILKDLGHGSYGQVKKVKHK